MPSNFTQNKARFSKLLDLYIDQSGKLSKSEINDLNDVFTLGMDLFEITRTLPGDYPTVQQCAITNKTTVETPQRSIPAIYVIMDLDDLITSHTPPTFKPDPRYPDKCQQRDYEGDKAEQEKVRVGALHFNPRIVINNAPTASDGAAIVNKKGFVLGGNGRTMMMKSLGNDKYQEYVSKLRCDIGIFGLSERDIDKHKKPVLVRIVSMEVNECALFSNILNQNLTQELDLVTKTVSFARQLSPADVSNIAKVFEDADSDTLASMLGDRKVVKKLQEIFRGAGIITAQNTSKWLKDGDVFTQEGRIATEGILVGTVLDDKDLIESARSFTEKIVRTIPLLLRMKRLPKQWNLIDDIQTVIRLEYERRQTGDTIDDFIAQISFAKPEVKEKEELIWRILSENSWLKWKNFLERYVKMGEDAVESESTGGGFFGETLEPMDAIRRLAKKQTALSGYSDDQARFESILDLYISNANKFTESEINELNEIFQMGMDLYGSLKVLPKFEDKTVIPEAPKEKKGGRGTKYEDYGEKIGGAKKDIYHRIEQMKEVSDDDIESLPLSKTFPKPDYVQMYSDGILTYDGAFVLKYLYDNIPTKPRKSYYIQSWARTVRYAIDIMTKTLVNNPEMSEKFTSAIKNSAAGVDKNLSRQFNHFYKLMQGLGFPSRDINLDGYDIKHFESKKKLNPATGELQPVKEIWQKAHIKDGIQIPSKTEYQFLEPDEVKEFTIVKDHYMIKHFRTWDEAVEALKVHLLIEDSKPKDTSTKFEIYHSIKNPKDEAYFIGKKMAMGVVCIVPGFESSTAARNYLKANYDDVAAKFEGMKAEIQTRRITNRPRVGKDWRNGKDITPEQFSKQFGFRGIEFGNWVNGPERTSHVNQAYDALMDLSLVTGLNPKAIALNGELGLAFGARGSKGASAHYERGAIVINLTRHHGSGTLAHEWFHALDNYFSRKRKDRGEFFTNSPWPKYNGKELDTAVSQATQEAFKDLISYIDGNKSALKKRSEQADTMRSKPYYSTRIEMCARAFESYVEGKLRKHEIVNDYLVNYLEEKAFTALYIGEKSTFPYPLPTEMEDVNRVYDNIFKAIQTTPHAEKDVHSLSDNMQSEAAAFPKIPAAAATEIASAIERAPQPQFARTMKNPAVANTVIRLLKEAGIITPNTQSAWMRDSTTLTNNGITLLREALWKELFPHSDSTDYPVDVTDKILKNLPSFKILKKNPTEFLQFEIALELGKEWDHNNTTFEQYCSNVIFDDPLDAEEFAVLCPFFYKDKSEKFEWILNKYVKKEPKTDRASFLKSITAGVGERVKTQQEHGLSDVYIWK